MEKLCKPKKDWQIAENLAVEYLEKAKRYKILEKNFRTPFGEIDIIACCKDVVIFVEVKSGNGKRILPSERVDKEKFDKIIKVAEYYLEHRLKDKIYTKVQIDVVEVVGSTIKHYEDIGWDFS